MWKRLNFSWKNLLDSWSIQKIWSQRGAQSKNCELVSSFPSAGVSCSLWRRSSEVDQEHVGELKRFRYSTLEADALFRFCRTDWRRPQDVCRPLFLSSQPDLPWQELQCECARVLKISYIMSLNIYTYTFSETKWLFVSLFKRKTPWHFWSVTFSFCWWFSIAHCICSQKDFLWQTYDLWRWFITPEQMSLLPSFKQPSISSSVLYCSSCRCDTNPESWWCILTKSIDVIERDTVVHLFFLFFFFPAGWK